MADMAGLEELTLPERLRAHRITLKSGDYDGADLMRAWCSMMDAATAIEQLEAIIAEKDAALEEEVRAAYIAGATDVHVYWRGLTGTERPEPDFAEAAGDYASFRAAAVLERKPDVASN